MILIPVIDLMGGHAVHARQGHRASYRPLSSRLCPDGGIRPLVSRLHQDFGCRLIYLADLDAISGSGNHDALLAGIASDFPRLQLWLDGGFRNTAQIAARALPERIRPVIGSETWQERAASPARDSVLSIDSDAEGLRDPSGIVTELRGLPDRLILMNLLRVGSRQGPDLALLQHWRRRLPDAHLFLAGGIRDRDDLDSAAEAGAAGVLLASALHDGRLQAADLAAFS